MAFSWQEQRLPAGAQTVPVEIQYLDRLYIHLYINGVEVRDFTWDSDTLIRFDRALEQESTVLLVRRTNREYLYLMFAEGAAFIKQNLDTQNLQFLHLSQELVEGRAIDGFFGSINMNGYTITNLGAGVNPGDAVNKQQLDTESARIASLENTFISRTDTYPWHTITTERTSVINPPFRFNKAAVYINGVCQTPDYSYMVSNNQILLAQAVPAGTHIFARLGEDVSTAMPDMATGEQVQAVAQRITLTEQMAQSSANSVNAATDVINAMGVNITTLSNTKAGTGANSDITSLNGLTTALSISQGGTGANNASAARYNLGLGGLATKEPAAAIADVTANPTQAQFNALLASLRAAGILRT